MIKQVEKVSVEVGSEWRANRRMPDLEASQRWAATFQKGIRKQDGALGNRQSRWWTMCSQRRSGAE
jgi:hypothetical protein